MFFCSNQAQAERPGPLLATYNYCDPGIRCLPNSTGNFLWDTISSFQHDDYYFNPSSSMNNQYDMNIFITFCAFIVKIVNYILSKIKAKL